jgi:branched-chain amino acid transport system permease protein
MDQLIQVLIIGLANGLIFALVALGYTLVYGIIELINFAHGDVFMLGSMLAYFLIAPQSAGAWGIFPITGDTPLPLLIAQVLAVLAICMVTMATLNVLIERIAYRPLRNAPKLAPLISAIGVSYVLQNVGLVWGGAYQRTIDSVFSTTNLLEPFGITTIVVTASQVFVAVVTIPLLIALSLFVSRTRQGKAMRATAQDPDTAGLMGVDVNRTIAITFLIGGGLAGAAGVAQLLYNNYTVYTLGFRFGLNSFTAAVLGGIGNLQGAVLGALVIGEVNALSDRYLSTNWTQAIVFGVLIAILVFKPTGLLGQQLADRA